MRRGLKKAGQFAGPGKQAQRRELKKAGQFVGNQAQRTSSRAASETSFSRDLRVSGPPSGSGRAGALLLGGLVRSGSRSGSFRGPDSEAGRAECTEMHSGYSPGKAHCIFICSSGPHQPGFGLLPARAYPWRHRLLCEVFFEARRARRARGSRSTPRACDAMTHDDLHGPRLVGPLEKVAKDSAQALLR